MNERIKELYQQAHREWHQEYFGSDIDPTVKAVSVTRHFDYELFAELIVKECADVITETRWHLPPTQQQIAVGIKEHFGVNE
jgi:hypothetical protein